MKKLAAAVVLCAVALASSACSKGESDIEKQHPSDSINTGDATTTNPAVVATDTSTTNVTTTDTTATSDISGTGATNQTGDISSPTTHTAGSETTGTAGTAGTP